MCVTRLARAATIEKYLRKHAAHKHMVLFDFRTVYLLDCLSYPLVCSIVDATCGADVSNQVIILNKCDLVPKWVTARWLSVLSAEYPTVAFHASLTHPFGKGALINLLRQFGTIVVCGGVWFCFVISPCSMLFVVRIVIMLMCDFDLIFAGKLHNDKKNISVGLIGYPNVGKSSIINTLRSKTVCKVARFRARQKSGNMLHLFRRIYLIDCPGIVYERERDRDRHRAEGRRTFL